MGELEDGLQLPNMGELNSAILKTGVLHVRAGIATEESGEGTFIPQGFEILLCSGSVKLECGIPESMSSQGQKAVYDSARRLAQKLAEAFQIDCPSVVSVLYNGEPIYTRAPPPTSQPRTPLQRLMRTIRDIELGRL